MTKGCKKFQEILHMNKAYKNRLENTISINPVDLVDRLCNNFNIDNDILIKIKNHQVEEIRIKI